MRYGEVDCIGGARFIAQQFYRGLQSMRVNIQDKVSNIYNNNLSACGIIDPDNLDAIPVGAVLFKKNLTHMGYYLGEYNGVANCIAETNGLKDTMHYDDLEERLYDAKGETGFYYWGVLSYLEPQPPEDEWLVQDE